MTGPFDELVGRLDYAMFVVTARSPSGRAGCLVGFAAQVSIDPSRFLVCISKQNHTLDVARESEGLAVHVIPEDAIELARLFGEQTGDDVDKFSRCEWSDGPLGLPVLAECPDWFAGPVIGRFDLGDHVGHLMTPEVVSDAGSGRPLMFSATSDLAPGHEA